MQPIVELSSKSFVINPFNKIKNMKTLNKLILLLIIAIGFNSCSEDDSCAIIPIQDVDPTTLACEPFENFESFKETNITTTIGNWVASEAQISIEKDVSGNTFLRAFDRSSPFPNWHSHIYNVVDFPRDFVSAGCILEYQFMYDANSQSNAISTTTSIVLFQGTNLNSNTEYARFILNTPVASQDPWTTIDIPLYLANPSFPSVLPSNSYGYWVMASGKTAVDFNKLIQNVDGIALLLDSGSSPSELWWYDNFCFKQCN